MVRYWLGLGTGQGIQGFNYFHHTYVTQANKEERNGNVQLKEQEEGRVETK